MKIINLFLFLSLMAPSLLAWNHAVSQGVRKLDEKLSISRSPFFDRYQFSLWGSIRARLYDPKPKKVNLKSRYLKNGVKSAYTIGDKNIAELYVYIPGIFNNVNEGQTSRAFVRMQKLAKNILVLPNPWGTDYLKAKPTHKPGDVLREAESLYDLTLDFLKAHDLPKDTKIRLFGASYGAFLAAVYANVDRSLAKNLVHKEVYIFSPPLNMGQTIRNIDQLMWEDDFFNRKISDKDMALAFLDYVFAKSESDLSVSSKILSTPLTVRVGFKDPFRDSIKIYFKGHPDYKPKEKYFFRTYIEQLAPELKALLSSEVADLDYWISSGKESYGLDIKVLSTQNDFLNNYVYSGLYPEDHYWFFENGGHLGFIELDEFVDFLKLTKSSQ